MGLFDQFPYTNFHELNLDWILKALKELEHTIDQFVAINALKYADPIQWNITSQYEKNTIVIDPLTGTAYISVQPVPAGVAITREEYWSVVFDLGSFVVRAAKNFTNHWESEWTLTATFPSNAGDWLVWNDTLYKVLSNIIAGDQYVIGSNIQHFTMEDIIGHLEDLTTTDKSNLVAAINEVASQVLGKIGDLNDLETTDKSNLVAAINEVVTNMGDLSSLHTPNIDNLVNAINDSYDKTMASSSFFVCVDDYGAVGDGSTDDSAAFTAAFAAVSTKGGTVFLGPKRYVIDNDITIPDGVTLHGCRSVALSQDDWSTRLNTTGGVILLNTSTTIHMRSSAAIIGVYVLRKGLVIPEANSSSFAGTAITVDFADSSAKTDVRIENCMVLGFNIGFTNYHGPRPIITHTNFDCLNCIIMDTVGDPLRIESVHCWPFCTAATPNHDPDNLYISRNGTAFAFKNGCDAAKISMSLEFGWKYGLTINNCAGVLVSDCGFDYSSPTLNPVGVYIDGTSSVCQIVDCQIVGKTIAIYQALDTSSKTNMYRDLYIFSKIPFSIHGGSLNATGCLINNCDTLIDNQVNDNYILMKDNIFPSVNNAPQIIPGGTPYIDVADNYYTDSDKITILNTDYSVPSLASTAYLAVPKTSKIFRITGTTNIAAFTNLVAGREYTFIFDDALTCIDTVNLILGSNFTTAANSVLKVLALGTDTAIEVSRKA